MGLERLISILPTLPLNELFVLQYEVVKHIQSKVSALEIPDNLTQKLIEANTVPEDEENISLADMVKSPLNSPSIKREESGSLEIIEDSQDFILTQLSNNSPQSSQIYSQQDHPPVSDSSPLREYQNTNSHKVVKSEKLNIKMESPSKSYKQQKLISSKDKKVSKLRVKKESLSPLDSVKISYEAVIPTKQLPPTRKLNFNMNPITKKPWILEDFKPNFEVTRIRRGRKEVEQFYSKVGKPDDDPKDFIGKDHSKNPSMKGNESEFIFDNLRQRSRSPPGFGRMDFPSTQERTDDKIKSQKIIYEKTIYRFRCAIDYKIPSYEREFLFKKDIFNKAVDENNFTWSPQKLQIFLRSK
ncbi:DNA endonuclease Sae2p [Monosporozyma servazzii]